MSSRADFIGENFHSRAFDTLVQTFNVIDSQRDDKNTQGDKSRIDSSFKSEQFETYKQGT